MLQSSQYRRVKERYIWEVIQKVQDWRTLFHDGLVDEAGNIQKLSLHEAAEYVGIPKKTLEDYQQLLKKAASKVQLSEIQDKKMGYLRKLIREGRVRNIKGIPGRKSIQQINQEYESTTHEQVQQQSHYQPHFEEEQKDQWSQDDQLSEEENFVIVNNPYYSLDSFNIPDTPQTACPEDMIIDGDILPESFDWEEVQIHQQTELFDLPQLYNPYVNMILIKESNTRGENNSSTLFNPANPFLDDETEVDLFELKDKYINESIDIADLDTDIEE